MTFFLQIAVSGFALGIVYALTALGLVIILKSSKVFNIAQGAFIMIGGYLFYTFLVMFNLPLWASLLLTMGVAAIMGLLIERLLLRPLVGQPFVTVIMVTIALLVLLEGLETLIWGNRYVSYHGVLGTASLRVGEVSLGGETLMIIIVSFIVVALLLLFFRYAKIGLAMRATAEDEQVVQSAGIRVTTIYALAWVIASVLGVIAGILLGSVTGVNLSLIQVGYKGFSVVLLGGMNSIGGAIIAGMILGVAENLAAGYLDPLLPAGGGLAHVFPFIVMMLVLIFKPYGLFGLVKIERI